MAIIASATDDRVEVVTSDKGQKGDTGTAGLDGAGFDAVRESLIDSPLCRLFTPNKLVDTLAGSLTWTRASTATYIDRYGVVKTATIDEPREESDGWLIEGASTNLLTYSEQFDNAAWVKSRASITATNVTTAPDGTITADELTDTSELNYHAIFQFNTVTAGQYYTYSCFVKANTLNQAGFQFSGVEFGSTESLFDLVSGTVITSINCTSTIKNLGNGWFKISSSALCSTSGNAATSIILGKSGTAFYSGDGASGVYIWGAQLEQLPLASSYIPTTTAPVTRAADLVSANSQNNVTKGDQVFSYTANINVFGEHQTNYIFGANTSGEGDVRSYLTPVNSSASSIVFVSGGSLINSSPVTISHNSSFSFTYTNDGVNFRGYIDSTEVGSVSAASAGTQSPSSISFGSNQTQTDRFLFGHIKDFRIYDFALNADEVKFLSGVK